MTFFENFQRKWENRSAVKASWASPFWVFLVFFGIMLVQNRFVFLYHDDYGYVTLSYAINIWPVRGTDFSLAQLGQFLFEHYTHWGGRVIPIGIEILVLRWGLWTYRIIQAMVITLVLMAAYTLLSRYFRRGLSRWLVAFALCCFYGLIDLELQRNGTYWASASVSYVWPFLALFLAAAIHLRLEEGGRTGWRLPVVIVLYFIAGSSQEQIGLSGIVFVTGIFLGHLWLKKSRQVLSVDIMALVAVLAGFAFLALAPGNLVRLNSPIYASFSRLTLAGKLTTNLPSIIKFNLGRQNQAILLLWVWSCVAVMAASYHSGKRPHRLYFLTFVLCVFFGLLLTIALLPASSALETWIFQSDLTTSSQIFWILFLFPVSMAVVLFCLEKGYIALLALYAGGLCSQAALAISPTLNVRSSLIFIFALFPVLAAMLVEVFAEGRGQTLVKLALLMIFTAAAFNTFRILHGYSANSPALETNDRVLRLAAQAIQSGKTVQRIELQKLPDDRYAGEMPYTPGYEYINQWIKEYYDLPLDIDLVWK